VSRIPARSSRSGERGSFFLYVEGPRDQGVLEAWARAVSPPLARALPPVIVILGGRQPARALEHFRAARERDATEHGLCVLDRDGRDEALPSAAGAPGLEFFTWGRRHIESYLLVPDAIRRSLRLRADDSRIERFFRSELPATDDELALRNLPAKPLFAAHGQLERLIGRPVRPTHVARAMRAGELHADVHALLGRLRSGLRIPDVEAVMRPQRAT
jgi:hypothetical protein